MIDESMELSNDTYVINLIGNEKRKDYSCSLVEVLSRYNNVSFAQGSFAWWMAKIIWSVELK